MKFQRSAIACTAVAIAIACVGIAGWFLDAPVLSRGREEWAAMSAPAGLMLLLCAGAILADCAGGAERSWLRRAARLAPAAVLALAGDVLLRYLLDGFTRARIDGAIFGSSLGSVSPAAALGLALLAAALLQRRDARGGNVRGGLIAAALTLCLVVLCGYLFDVETFSGAERASAMALLTVCALTLLLSAALLARPAAGWMRVLTEARTGGRIARRLLPYVILVPLVLSGVILMLLTEGYFDWRMGGAVQTAALIAALAALVIGAGSWLNSSEDRREQSERRRRESERLVQAIFDYTTAPIYLKDIDGRFQLANRQFCALFEKEPDEVIGRTDADLLPADAVQPIRATDARVIAERRTVIEEESVPIRGDLRHYVSVKTPLLGENGEPEGLFGISTDITDRKSAEMRLGVQLERMKLLHDVTRAVSMRQDVVSVFQATVRAVEEHLPADFACICRYDARRHVLSVAHVGVNSAALGAELGITENAVIAVDENGLSTCIAQRTLVYEPDVRDSDYAFPQRLARHQLRSLVLAPIPLEGKAFGLLVVARFDPNAFFSADTEFLSQLGEHVGLAAQQAELRDHLETAYRDLQQTQQAALERERLSAIGQMASGIAHDINNAISPVSVYTQALQERAGELDPAVRSYLDTVSGVVKDLASTIARMRDFYRPSDAEELETVVLNDLVPQVISLTRARWHDMPLQRGTVISVETDLQDDLPPLTGNPAELRELMTNLIFNAVDAMPEGGAITIRTRAAGATNGAPAQVTLEVRDTGVGMDEETRRHCLEPFFTTKGERGTGLGLAMVYGSVRRHRASMDIESAPGEGTGFRFGFPVTEAGSEPETVSATRPSRALRLLLVDDDPAVLRSNQFVLDLDGHDTVTADGGRAALDVLAVASEADKPFDAVITDLGMPHVDGNEVARAVKAKAPRTAVVLLTGWGRRMGSRDSNPEDVDFVLSKPLQIDELREVLARIEQAGGTAPN